MRKAAAAVVGGEQVIAEAVEQLRPIKAEVDRGEYAFIEMPSPKGSCAFEATNKACSAILVGQSNHATEGVRYFGTAIRKTPSGPMIVNFPKELADHIYHQATAARN